MKKKTGNEKTAAVLYIIQRIVVIFAICAMFLPAFNPTSIVTVVDDESVDNTASLFSSITINREEFMPDIQNSIIADKVDIDTLFNAGIVIVVSIIIVGCGACLSLGNKWMKRGSHLISVVGAMLMIIGSVLIVNFCGDVSEAINSVADSETTSDSETISDNGTIFSATLTLESSAKTRTLNGGHWSSSDENVYNLTITNISGQELNGWAVGIYVGTDYDISNVLMINKWQSILKDETVYPFNYEILGEYLVITPGNYTLENGELVLDESNDGSLASEISSISEGSLQITLIADGISTEANIITLEDSAFRNVVADETLVTVIQCGLPMAVYIYIAVSVFVILISVINELFIVSNKSENVYQTEDTTSSQSSNMGNVDVADEILKYKELYDQGILTSEEYQKKKDELLRK